VGAAAGAMPSELQGNRVRVMVSGSGGEVRG
jgi:hypothetical protein